MIDICPSDNGFAFIVVMLCVLHIKKEKQNRGDSTFPYLVSIMKKLT